MKTPLTCKHVSCALAALTMILGGSGCMNGTGDRPASAAAGSPQAHADNGGSGTGAPVSHVGPSGAGPAGSQ